MILNNRLFYFNLSNVFRSLSSGLISIFGVIFIYELFNDLFLAVVLAFGLRYLVYILLVPFTGSLFGKIKRAYLFSIGTFFNAISFLCMIFLQDNPLMLVVLYGVFTGIYYAFFFIPYHVSLVELTNDESRGREMAYLAVIGNIISAITPLAAGFIILKFGYTHLFSLSLIFTFLSIIPLLSVKDKKTDHFDYGVKKTLQCLIGKGHRNLFLAHFIYGFNFVAKIILWPLFIFILLDGEYLDIGLITSAALVVVIFLNIIIGKLLDDKHYGNKVMKFTAKAEVLGWIFRIFSVAPIQILLSDMFYRFSSKSNELTIAKTFYDHVDSEPSCSDEFLVVRSMALNLGRICMLIAAYIIFIIFGGLKYAFILAMVAALFTEKFQKEEVMHLEKGVCE